MKHTYKTKGVCAREIQFDVDADNLVRNVRFVGGCAGNAIGLSAVVEGMPVAEVIKRLKGTQCRYGTSCPDQLAIALSNIDEAQG